jgi:DNA (cytosine-5)-methyltransferase 1
MDSKINRKYTIGGLCSGVGGIELGFQNAGFEISWANDMDFNAMKTYHSIIGSNHYIGAEAMSIRDVIKKYSSKLPKVNVLAAGFPCQAFSIAGKRKGFDDARGTVIWDIFDLLDRISKNENGNSVDVLFLENVKNFKTHNGEHTYKTIESKLYGLGYSVYTKVLNTADYTLIPQNRERTFMICFKGESDWEDFKFHEFDATNEQTEQAKKYCPRTFALHKNFPNRLVEKKFLNLEKIIEKIVDDKYWYPFDSKYVKMLNSLYKEMQVNEPGSEDTFYQIRRVYPRANKQKLCPTLTANMGTGGHNVPLLPFKKGKKLKWRKLTPLECFKLQGYENIHLPEGVSNGQLYKQAGNSVSVPVIGKLARVIKKALESHSKDIN